MYHAMQIDFNDIRYSGDPKLSLNALLIVFLLNKSPLFSSLEPKAQLGVLAV